jgi:hypothetical protein
VAHRSLNVGRAAAVTAVTGERVRIADARGNDFPAHPVGAGLKKVFVGGGPAVVHFPADQVVHFPAPHFPDRPEGRFPAEAPPLGDGGEAAAETQQTSYVALIAMEMVCWSPRKRKVVGAFSWSGSSAGFRESTSIGQSASNNSLVP